MGSGSFPGVKCDRHVLLTTHPLPVPRSWKSRAIPLPTLWATPDLQRNHLTFYASDNEHGFFPRCIKFLTWNIRTDRQCLPTMWWLGCDTVPSGRYVPTFLRKLPKVEKYSSTLKTEVAIGTHWAHSTATHLKIPSQVRTLYIYSLKTAPHNTSSSQ